jgi:CPA1 family monovalent cation:H+ antiporter
MLVAAVVLAVTKKLRFPYSVALVLVGIALKEWAERGPEFLHQAAEIQVSPQVILFVFLPTLLFESAFHLDARSLRRNLVPILTLAVPGLIVSTVLIGAIVSLLTPLTFPIALLLGAILSATDPVAVVALFRQLGAPHRLTTLVEGESLFNDATALVLAKILTGVVVAGVMSMNTVVTGTGQFFLVFLGGILVGWIMALIAGLLLGRIESDPLLEISITTVLAYGSFLVAEELFHVSGVMATVAAAVTMGGWGRAKISHSVHEYLEHFWEYFAFMANALIFLLVGLRVELGALWDMAPVLACVVLAMLVSRAAVIYGLIPIIGKLPNSRSVDMRYRTVMYWGGLRGAIAIAIVLTLPHVDGTESLVTLVTGAVLFTLLAQGLTMEPLVKKLGLDKPTLADRVARTETGLLAKHAARGRVPELQAGGLFNARIADKLRKSCEDGISELKAELASLRGGELGHEQEHRLLHLRCLAVEAAYCFEMFGRGHLSEQAFRDLAGDAVGRADALRHEGRVPEAELAEQRGGPFVGLLGRVLDRIGLRTSAERLRRWEVAREYEQAWGRYQASHRVLAQLPEIGRTADVDADLLRKTGELYEGWRDQAQNRLDQTAELFPEFVGDMQERLAGRLLVHAEREVIEHELHAGSLSVGVAEGLLGELGERLRGLRGRTSASLHLDPAELLRTVPLFAGTPPEDVERVAAQLQQRTVPAGETILRQGDRGDSLFLIVRGVVRVVLESEGSPVDVATLMAGDFFGEMALLRGEPRTATCRAVTPSALLELKKADFDAVRAACPGLKAAIEVVEKRRRAELSEAERSN